MENRAELNILLTIFNKQSKDNNRFNKQLNFVLFFIMNVFESILDKVFMTLFGTKWTHYCTK